MRPPPLPSSRSMPRVRGMPPSGPRLEVGVAWAIRCLQSRAGGTALRGRGQGFHGVCYRARESEVAKASDRCARRDIICRIPAASARRAFEDADLWTRRRHDGGAPYRQWQDATPVGRSRGRAARSGIEPCACGRQRTPGAGCHPRSLTECVRMLVRKRCGAAANRRPHVVPIWFMVDDGPWSWKWPATPGRSRRRVGPGSETHAPRCSSTRAATVRVRQADRHRDDQRRPRGGRPVGAASAVARWARSGRRVRAPQRRAGRAARAARPSRVVAERGIAD
jgi:hypothetical protein